jgi:hypothetical protein
MSPISAARDQIIAMAPSGFSDALGHLVEGLFYDLRGCLQPCRKAHSYKMFSQYVLTTCMPIFKLASEPSFLPLLSIRNSLLRLIRELLDNSNKRIEFSPRNLAPLLLVRECSAILASCGTYLQRSPIDLNGTGVYEKRFSSIRSCWESVHSIIAGEYVNLSLMAFYSDPTCLILPLVLNLAVSVPHDHVLNYGKLSSIFAFLQYYADAFPAHFLALSPEYWENCLSLLRQALLVCVDFI